MPNNLSIEPLRRKWNREEGRESLFDERASFVKSYIYQAREKNL